jgi:hypothetical protein
MIESVHGLITRMISSMMSNMISPAILFLLLCRAYFSVGRKRARRKGRGLVNTERSARMMFNNYLYEMAMRERYKDMQREMEQLRLLASLQRSKTGVRRYIAERVGILLIKLGMKLKQGARLEVNAQ